MKGYGLLSMMPAFVCANTDEENFRNFGTSEKAKALVEFAAKHGMEVVPVCAKLEEELGQLEEEEAAMFMEELGIKETGLARVIRTGYRLLDYITFFTAGPMESRAWTVTRRHARAAGGRENPYRPLPRLHPHGDGFVRGSGRRRRMGESAGGRKAPDRRERVPDSGRRRHPRPFFGLSR